MGWKGRRHWGRWQQFKPQERGTIYKFENRPLSFTQFHNCFLCFETLQWDSQGRPAQPSSCVTGRLRKACLSFSLETSKRKKSNKVVFFFFKCMHCFNVPIVNRLWSFNIVSWFFWSLNHSMMWNASLSGNYVKQVLLCFSLYFCYQLVKVVLPGFFFSFNWL